MIVNVRAIVVAVVVGGCTFSTQTQPDDPSGLCPFDVTSDYIDPCAVTPPVELAALPDVTITDMTSIDTGTGDIVGTNVFTPPPSSVVEGMRVVWTHTFTIASGGTLRAYGGMPLVIVATSAIRIEGTLDATSNPSSAGAGANPPSCGAATGGAGTTCAQHGGSGGGGGAFGAAGGAGGEGGNTHECVTGVDGRPGGAGGIATAAVTLVGGCAGGNGAPSNAATGMIGPGGAGGGAILLIARDKVIVGTMGRLLAGGGGGQPGRDRAGGGGGGSGGMIVIESVDVDLQPSSVVAANGGGGAGGGDGAIAEPGQPGLPSDDDANGGDEDPNGGKGGDGGVVLVEAGKLGALASRGGGGRGGGVGFIRVHAKTGSQSGLASPAIAKN